MSIELKPSRNWPGRTDLIHRTHPESSLTSSSPLTPEDMAELREALNPKVTTVKELLDLPVGTVLVANGHVGEVRGIDDMDEDGNPIVSRAIFWAGSDLFDYLDGFALDKDPNPPFTIVHTLTEG